MHRWAVLTACAALPLLLLGAEVTTKKVGMVDDKGFREPWHMLTVPLQEKGLGFVIEHSHRLAGFVVGTCIIVLAVSLWRREPRRWVRWLGVVVLAAVSVQGLLGGFRVKWNALVGPEFALIHGCFAQIVFALLVGLAVITSRGWLETTAAELSPQVRRWSLVVAGLVYLQIAFGAFVRHTESSLAPRLHLLAAFAVTAAVVWLAKLALDSKACDPLLTQTVKIQLALLALQLLLGVESWLAKFPSLEHPQLRPLPLHPELFRSLHYLVGALLFAASIAAALQAYRGLKWSVNMAAMPVGRWEGAA